MTTTQQLIEFDHDAVIATFAIGGLDEYVNDVRSLVDNFEHDLSTATSRKRTASFSAKIAKLKVIVDTLGKNEVASEKLRIKAIDNARKRWRDQMDELKAEARQPLTQWERDEEARLAAIADAEMAEELAKQIEADHELGALMNVAFDRDRADAIRAKEAEALRVAQEAEAKRQEIAIAAQAEADKRARAAAQAEVDAAKARALEAVQAMEAQKALDAKRIEDAEEAAKQKLLQAQAIEQLKAKEEEANNYKVAVAKAMSEENIRRRTHEATEDMMGLGMSMGVAQSWLQVIRDGGIRNVILKMDD